jgi:gamma-butyrobetaine dioxygenase
VTLAELSVDITSVMPPGVVDAQVVDGRLHVRLDGVDRVFHPHWLLDRSGELRDVDPTSRQRLFEPADVPIDFAVAGVSLDSTGAVSVAFNNGRRLVITLKQLSTWLGLDPEAPPAARPWPSLDALPTIAWGEVFDDAPVRDVLEAFHTLGVFVITGTPTVPGSLHDITRRFGRVSPTSFGSLFDVRSVPDPEDLAYATVGLSAHLDQPYRHPTPGIQFLHTLVNDAPGGESTVVDGLAAIDALRRHDHRWFTTLCDLPIEFRYDIGCDVVVATAPMIEIGADGRLRQFRYSPRLDFAPYADPDVLDAYYGARRWLAEWLNDPAHQFEFKMSPGDVLVVDNHRVLHGRRAFASIGGHRRLQGCYIDHDGPATMWRLLSRQQRDIGAER